MTQKISIEEQLRHYADAVDPSSSARTGSPAQGRRGPGLRTTWFAAAAAVVMLIAGVALAQRDAVQQVETGDFAQQPPDRSDGAERADGPMPLPDDVPATGDWRTPQDSLAVLLAYSELVGECMEDQGFNYVSPTDQERIEVVGSWQPHGILGIGTEGAARLLGYQDHRWGGAGSPSQAVAWQALTPEARESDSAALRDCQGFAESQLGDYQSKEIEFDEILQFGADGTQGERFRTDPQLAAALADWQDCIREATGAEADTPNTLARQYAFGGGNGAQRERDVAVADVRCQQKTKLKETFYIARTKQVRAELGEQARVFDDYVRMRIETVAMAKQVLTERGIVPPSLD